MTTYQPGDRVVVRDDLECDVRYRMDHNSVTDVATTAMCHLAGQVVTIDHINSYGKYRIRELEGLNWTDEMFDGLADECLTGLDDLL